MNIMKNFLFSLLIIGCFISSIYAQEDYNKGSFLDFNLGIGFDDGLYRTDLPTVGLGYQYKFSKYFALGSDIITYYRKFGQSLSFNGEFVNIIYRDTENILINSSDTDNLNNVGIADLYSKNTLLHLDVPISLKAYVYPIHIKNHHFGVVIGVTGIFGTYKSHRDIPNPEKIILLDGTQLSRVAMAQEVEFRNFVLGGNLLCLTYEYSHKKNVFGLSMTGYNHLWDAGGDTIIFNLAAVFRFKI